VYRVKYNESDWMSAMADLRSWPTAAQGDGQCVPIEMRVYCWWWSDS